VVVEMLEKLLGGCLHDRAAFVVAWQRAHRSPG
jgi:hypothetical protein